MASNGFLPNQVGAKETRSTSASLQTSIEPLHASVWMHWQGYHRQCRHSCTRRREWTSASGGAEQTTGSRGGLTQQQMQDFRHQVLGNPLEKVTREMLEAKWAAFSATARRVGEEACVQHPIGACRAGEGAVHEIMTACHTRCGIYWAAGAYSICSLAPNCKSCTGSSARWAREAPRHTPQDR